MSDAVIAIHGPEGRAVIAKLQRVLGGMRGIRFEGAPRVVPVSSAPKPKTKTYTHVLAASAPQAESAPDGGIAEQIAAFFADRVVPNVQYQLCDLLSDASGKPGKLYTKCPSSVELPTLPSGLKKKLRSFGQRLFADIAARARYGLARPDGRLHGVVQSCVELCGNALTANRTVAPFLASASTQPSGKFRKAHRAEMQADKTQTAVSADLFKMDTEGTAHFPRVWIGSQAIVRGLGRYYSGCNELQVAREVLDPKIALQHGRTLHAAHDKVAQIVLHEMLHWYCARFVYIEIPTFRGETDPGHGVYSWQILAKEMLGDLVRERYYCVASDSIPTERIASLRQVASPMPSLRSSMPVPTGKVQLFVRSAPDSGASFGAPWAAWMKTADGTVLAEQPAGTSAASSAVAPVRLTQANIVQFEIIEYPNALSLLLGLVDIHTHAGVEEKIYYLGDDGTFSVQTAEGELRFVSVETIAYTMKISRLDLWKAKLAELKELLPKK